LFVAEKFLESVELSKNYPVLLLHLIEKDAVNGTIRVAGAIAFKNYVKRNWKIVGSQYIYLPYFPSGLFKGS
jgi:exportin-2 (importin alpha re-exporter)